jgi:hypothetical protein
LTNKTTCFSAFGKKKERERASGGEVSSSTPLSSAYLMKVPDGIPLCSYLPVPVVYGLFFVWLLLQQQQAGLTK